MKLQKGFTIIELIVVIAIIAVLAGIILVNVSSYGQKAKQTATLASVKQMANLVNMYIVDASADGTSSGFCNDSNTQNKLSNIYNQMNGSSGSGIYCRDLTYYFYNSTAGTQTLTSPNCQGKTSAWLVYAKLVNPDNSYNIFCIDSVGNVTQSSVFNIVKSISCLCQ